MIKEAIITGSVNPSLTQTLTQTVKECAEQGRYKFRVSYKDGRTIDTRLFVGDKTGWVCEFKPRSSTKGHFFPVADVVSIVCISAKPTSELTFEEKLKKAVKYYQYKRNFFLKHAHRDLWPDLWKQFTEDKTEQLIVTLRNKWEQSTEKDYLSHSYFDVRHDLDIPWFEDNRPNILDVSKLFYFSSINLALAIKAKRDYSARGFGKYDYSVSYQAADNAAWFSEEYKGCLNGHYYLLISEKVAMFTESD
jgi:hypothetical protein